jgi:4-hydroxy-tetrahydrodipicolinate synthase
MTALTTLCRTATTFDQAKNLDEGALAAFLGRLADAGLGFYLGSGGSGEGHALSLDELERVYRVGVSVAGGKVQANANLPEQHTVANTVAQAEVAVRAGVDVINVYGPTGWHGYRPTDAELLAYYDDVLGQVRHPVAVAPNPIIGYTPSAELTARICDRHHQVVAVNLAGLSDNYFIRLKDALRREVDVYVPYRSSWHTLRAGAAGLLGAEANIIPQTFRRYLDAYAAGDDDGLTESYAELVRFSDYVQRWHTTSPRWLKMSMTVLGLPGAAGGVRDPYRDPAPEQLEEFATGLRRLEVREIQERLALASGPAPAATVEGAERHAQASLRRPGRPGNGPDQGRARRQAHRARRAAAAQRGLRRRLEQPARRGAGQVDAAARHPRAGDPAGGVAQRRRL